jgi:hypothetical protein
MWSRLACWLRRIDRSPLLACFALAASMSNLGCDDGCDGHDSDEHWCDHDRLLVCRWESSGNYAETLEQCMPGGCYIGPQKGGGCRVPDYTCPSGVTGYQCLGDRRIQCGVDGTAWDYHDCSQDTTQGAPTRHCVENPEGEMLACGYTNKACATPGEVRCLGEGSVVCRDSVWQGYVPSTAVGQSACDASSIRYNMGWCSTRDSTWCEADEVRLCDKCVVYGDYESLCVEFTVLAQCEPGACSGHGNDVFPSHLTGCRQSAAECSSAGQPVCIADRPGYCVEPGVVALDRPCSEIFELTPICKTHVDKTDPGDPISNYVTCGQ